MIDETQQNKIDLVKDMVFNECLENNYIRKHKKENRYITNITRKKLLTLTEAIVSPKIYNELKRYIPNLKNFDVEYVYMSILLISLYKLVNNYKLKLDEDEIIKIMKYDNVELIKYYIKIREHTKEQKEEQKRNIENNFLSNKMLATRTRKPKIEYPEDYTPFINDYSPEQRNQIIGQSGAMRAIPHLMGQKKQFVRNSNLMDPRYAAQLAQKRGYKFSANTDWDGDGINDVVLIDKDNRIRAYNGYTMKNSDWIYKQPFYEKPRGQRPRYNEYMREEVQGITTDFDNYAYNYDKGIYNPEWKAVRRVKEISPKKRFDEFIIKPIWDAFYKQYNAPKINFSKFSSMCYRLLVLSVLHGTFENAPEFGSIEQKVENKVRNSKEGKERCNAIITNYKGAGDLLVNFIMFLLQREYTQEEIPDEVQTPLADYINNNLMKFTLPDEIIQEAYNKYGNTEYKPPTRNDFRKSMRNTRTQFAGTNQWIRNVNNGDLKDEELD